MRLQILIIILFLAFASCKNKEENYSIQSFPIEKLLLGTVLCSDICIGNPYDMCCTNQHIVLLSLNNGNFLHFYNKRNGEYVKSQISCGNGKNEYNLISDLTFNPSKQILYYSETNKERIIGVSVSDSLNLQKVYERHLAGNTKVFRKGIFLNDSKNLIEGQSINGEPWLQITDSTNSIVCSYAETLGNSIEDAAFASQTNSVTSPSGIYYARATLFGGILQILKIENNHIVSQYIGRHIKPIGEIKGLSFIHTDKTILGYCDLFASNKYLYGVILNSCEVSKSSIIILDWKGNPIAKFNSDKLIRNICLDPEDESVLYALTVKDGVYNLEKYIITDNI